MNVEYTFDEELINKDFSPMVEMLDNEKWKDHDVYQNHITFRRKSDVEQREKAVFLLYDNFMETQIKLGKHLNFFCWWGKPDHFGFERIGWCAFCEKRKPIDTVVKGLAEVEEGLTRF